MDDTRFDIDAHDLFQFGNADVVVVQGLDMVDLGFVEAQLGIEDVQVDADAGLVTDILDTIVFTGLVDDGLRFFDLLGGTADVEVGLLDFQLDGFAGLLFRFTGDEESLFGLVNFGLGRTAVVETISDTSTDVPAALVSIDTRKVLSFQLLPPETFTVGLLLASAISMLFSAV